MLDRTKETGRAGEPLYLDVVDGAGRARGAGSGAPCRGSIGGRYGLSSKEFTPAMVKAVLDELAKPTPRNTSPSASPTTCRTPA